MAQLQELEQYLGGIKMWPDAFVQLCAALVLSEVNLEGC